MKVGILGGTFNPIHHGHLIIAEHIRLEEKLDKIIFIPTGLPPHKDRHQVLQGETRAEMVALAIESNPHFHLSRLEIEKKKTSYTLDTVKLLKKENPQDDFYLIIGGDSLMDLKSWKGHGELISSVDIVVGDRYNACGETIMEEINRLNLEMGGRIKNIKSPIIEISSTEIRKKILRGESIKYLLPEKVENFILKRGLYFHEKK